MEEKEEATRPLPAERAKREISAAVEQLTKDVSAVTMKVGEQVGALMASLEQDVKEVGGLKKEREATDIELSELCKG